MRKRFIPALALLMLAAPASAGCRLSTADCEVIAEERALEVAAQRQDETDFALGLPAAT